MRKYVFFFLVFVKEINPIISKTYHFLGFLGVSLIRFLPIGKFFT